MNDSMPFSQFAYAYSCLMIKNVHPFPIYNALIFISFVCVYINTYVLDVKNKKLINIQKRKLLLL